jgi:hypothetical protein
VHWVWCAAGFFTTPTRTYARLGEQFRLPQSVERCIASASVTPLPRCQYTGTADCPTSTTSTHHGCLPVPYVCSSFISPLRWSNEKHLDTAFRREVLHLNRLIQKFR